MYCTPGTVLTLKCVVYRRHENVENDKEGKHCNNIGIVFLYFDLLVFNCVIQLRCIFDTRFINTIGEPTG